MYIKNCGKWIYNIIYKCKELKNVENACKNALSMRIKCHYPWEIQYFPWTYVELQRQTINWYFRWPHCHSESLRACRHQPLKKKIKNQRGSVPNFLPAIKFSHPTQKRHQTNTVTNRSLRNKRIFQPHEWTQKPRIFPKENISSFSLDNTALLISLESSWDMGYSSLRCLITLSYINFLSFWNHIWTD